MLLSPGLTREQNFTEGCGSDWRSPYWTWWVYGYYNLGWTWLILYHKLGTHGWLSLNLHRLKVSSFLTFPKPIISWKGGISFKCLSPSRTFVVHQGPLTKHIFRKAHKLPLAFSLDYLFSHFIFGLGFTEKATSGGSALRLCASLSRPRLTRVNSSYALHSAQKRWQKSLNRPPPSFSKAEQMNEPLYFIWRSIHEKSVGHTRAWVSTRVEWSQLWPQEVWDVSPLVKHLLPWRKELGNEILSTIKMRCWRGLPGSALGLPKDN